MAEEKKAEDTKPDAPAAKYPRLRKLGEMAITIALAVLAAKLGIPLAASADVALVEHAAPVEVFEVAGFAPLDADGTGAVLISGATDYPAHSLVKLKAQNLPAGAAVLWRVSPRAGVERASTKADVLEFAAKPGAYDVELLVLRHVEGVLSVDEVFTRVTVGEKEPKKDPEPKKEPKGSGKLDPLGAIASIQFGTAGCTAEVIGPRRADGRWDILTACHCIERAGGVGAKGKMRLPDGRAFTVRVVVAEDDADLAWMVTEDPVEDMPYAVLAKETPAKGSKVWHKGYGLDKPGNREDGEVAADQGATHKTKFILSVSPGDSGGPIFNDKDEVVSTVCCTERLAAKAGMYGAKLERVRKARPGEVRLDLMKVPAPLDDEPKCCH